jgi:ribosome-associated translation inhibitor RaiA
MIQVTFKNLEPSELARCLVEDRLSEVIEQFHVLTMAIVRVTVEMHNSPTQPGPDLFSVTVHVENGVLKGLRLTKSSHSFYLALAELCGVLHETVVRSQKRRRVTTRKHGRRAVLAEAETQSQG